MIRDKLETGIGARVKMSALGAARCPRLAAKEGIIVGCGCYNSIARVLFDGSKSPISLHRDYIELTSSAMDRFVQLQMCVLPNCDVACAGCSKESQAAFNISPLAVD
jgi:hypothetical protein